MALSGQFPWILLASMLLLVLSPTTSGIEASSEELLKENNTVFIHLPDSSSHPFSLMEASPAELTGVIQTAINTADPGAVVEIATGTYDEELVIIKPLTLTAAPSATVLLQGDGSGVAVSVDHTHDVVIANLSIDSYTRAIAVLDSHNITLYGNYIINSGASALRIRSSQNCTAVYNTIDYTNKFWNSFYVFNSSGCSVISNTINARGQSKGLSIEYSRNSTVKENFVENSHSRGIRITNSGNSTVIGNIVHNCSSFGLSIARSGNSKVVENQIRDSGETGLYLNVCENSTIMNNTIINSGWNGLVLRWSNHSTVIGNTIRQSNLIGLALASSENCTVNNNLINNEWNGLQLLVDNVSIMECAAINHTPSQPGVGDAVIVSTNVSNPFGIEIVFLSYTTGKSRTNVTMEFNASQGLFIGIIPGQAAGTTIQFHLYAQDNYNNWFESEIYTYEIPGKANDSPGYQGLLIFVVLFFLTEKRTWRRQ